MVINSFLHRAVALSSLGLLFTAGCGGGVGSAGDGADPAEILSPGRIGGEFRLSADLHPQGVSLLTRVYFPDGGGPNDAGASYPVAFGYHGSGGLTKEPSEPGQECTTVLETKYQEMTDFLLARGVAVVWVDSFSSRDPRFCEDNTDAFRAYAPKVMDGGLQQVVSRVYDTAVAESELCRLARLDCDHFLRIGTSEGGTAALLPTHRYLDHSIAQLFDADSPKNKLAELADIAYEPLPSMPQPRFVMAISPGCGFYGAIPFSADGDVPDLFYPAQNVYLEIGGNDSIPDECSQAVGDGRRELQAEAVKAAESISDGDYRYHVTVYPGGEHELWDTEKEAIKEKLDALIKEEL